MMWCLATADDSALPLENALVALTAVHADSGALAIRGNGLALLSCVL